MTKLKLTFSDLDNQIEQNIIDKDEPRFTPKKYRMLNIIGFAGTFFGLLPSLFVGYPRLEQCIMPVGFVGFVAMIVGFGPGFIQDCKYLFHEIFGWRKSLVNVVDSRFEEHQKTINWLVQFPKEQLQERFQFIHKYGGRVNDRIGLMFGSFAKLGFIPMFVAVITQILELINRGALPTWWILSAIFLIIGSMLTFTTSLMVLRAQLYASLLENALHKSGKKD